MSHTKCRSFSEGVSPRIIVLERQPGKQSLRLKRSHEITTEPIAECPNYETSDQKIGSQRRYVATAVII